MTKTDHRTTSTRPAACTHTHGEQQRHLSVASTGSGEDEVDALSRAEALERTNQHLRRLLQGLLVGGNEAEPGEGDGNLASGSDNGGDGTGGRVALASAKGSGFTSRSRSRCSAEPLGDGVSGRVSAALDQHAELRYSASDADSHGVYRNGDEDVGPRSSEDAGVGLTAPAGTAAGGARSDIGLIEPVWLDSNNDQDDDRVLTASLDFRHQQQQQQDHQQRQRRVKRRDNNSLPVNARRAEARQQKAGKVEASSSPASSPGLLRALRSLVDVMHQRESHVAVLETELRRARDGSRREIEARDMMLEEMTTQTSSLRAEVGKAMGVAYSWNWLQCVQGNRRVSCMCPRCSAHQGQDCRPYVSSSEPDYVM